MTNKVQTIGNNRVVVENARLQVFGRNWSGRAKSNAAAVEKDGESIIVCTDVEFVLKTDTLGEVTLTFPGFTDSDKFDLANFWGKASIGMVVSRLELAIEKSGTGPSGYKYAKAAVIDLGEPAEIEAPEAAKVNRGAWGLKPRAATDGKRHVKFIRVPRNAVAKTETAEEAGVEQ